jgi:flagellar basal-body rod modification protein FlgD
MVAALTSDPLKSTSDPTVSLPGAASVDKDAFLKLLVAQVSNQDPMQPQDSDQYMQQITQFSMLEQLMNVNQGLATLQVGQLSANSQEALRFVGRNVLATGDSFDVAAGQGASMRYRAGDDARTITVTITDDGGKTVRTEQLPAATGIGDYEWDGHDDNGRPVPAGHYHVGIDARDANGDPVAVDTYVRGTVTGIRFDSGYPELLVGDRRLKLSDILEVSGSG